MPEEVACPECAQQPHEECRWGSIASHPRFHAARIEAASFIAGVESGAGDDDGSAPTDEEMKVAIDAAADGLV